MKPKTFSTIASRLLPAIFAFQAFALFASPLVKQSNSGICHPPESSWYDRTDNYTAHNSIEDCLDVGGRLPKGMSLQAIQTERNPSSEYQSYERSAFGHGWDDSDSDCQNSRAEALNATSTTQVRFAEEKRCRVVTGRWISPFTNQVNQNASDIDIDHVVPLAWSWSRGAGQWSREKRERFANDPVNLWPVEASLNRSKGARGPDKWLPPAGQCGYVARFVRIVKVYRLEPRAAENEWMRAFLDRCRS